MRLALAVVPLAVRAVWSEEGLFLTEADAPKAVFPRSREEVAITPELKVESRPSSVAC